MKERIKILLATENPLPNQDQILDILIERYTKKALNMSNRSESCQELDLLVEQAVIMAYNRIGSEGITSTSYAGISESYTDTDQWLSENIVLNGLRLMRL